MGKNMELQISHGHLAATLATVFSSVPFDPPRSVLWDMWWLRLQCDPQHYQLPSGSRSHGGDGLQEKWIQEVQSPHHRQHGLLCHRWRQQPSILYISLFQSCRFKWNPRARPLSDKIPLAVTISQKGAANQSHNVFFRGMDVVFRVQLHDPSGYLKNAAAIDYIWDFRDGNQVVTHRSVTTHIYSVLGTMNVKLVVEAAFPTQCLPTAVPTTPQSSTTPPSTGTWKRHVDTNRPIIIWIIT